MKRLPLTIETLRALFARSGNQCYFPGCTHQLINEKNQFVAQVAHIEGVKRESKRFNPNQSDEQRRSYDNLIILCYAHHVEIDADDQEFTVPQLKEMKKNHESRFSESQFSVSDSVLEQIINETANMWQEYQFNIDHVHAAPEFAVSFDKNATLLELVEKLWTVLRRLSNLTDALPHSDFESQSIGIPNSYLDITSIVLHLELKLLEHHLSINPNDEKANKRLQTVRQEILRLSHNVGYVD